MNKKTNRKFLRLGITLVAICGIGGGVATATDVMAKNKIGINQVAPNKKNIINNNRKNKKSHKIQKPSLTLESNTYLLNQQLKGANNNLKKTQKAQVKNKQKKINKYRTQINQIKAEIKRLQNDAKFLKKSPKMKRAYNWYAKNGLNTYDKYFNHNLAYHHGFVDGESISSTDSRVQNKYARNKKYEQGWLVGYASRTTSNSAYPKAKNYEKAYQAYDMGTIFARYNVVNVAYLEMPNVWGNYDI